MLQNATFGEGVSFERQKQAKDCIGKHFGGHGLGVLTVSLAYQAGRGYLITEASVRRSKGQSYKPGDTFERDDAPEDYTDKVRAALKECGLEVV